MKLAATQTINIPSPAARKASAGTLDASIAEVWSQTLAPGERLTLTFGDGEVVELEGNGNNQAPPAVDNFFDDLKKVGKSVWQEIAIGAKTGPCLALTLAGEAVKPILTQGLEDEMVQKVNGIYNPAMRGLCLTLSAAQCLEAWRRSQRKHADNQPISVADRLNVITNAVHVATSVIGVAGAIAAASSPALQHIGRVGMAIGYGGDLISFAANRMQYVATRSRTTEEALAQQLAQPYIPM